MTQKRELRRQKAQKFHHIAALSNKTNVYYYCTDYAQTLEKRLI